MVQEIFKKRQIIQPLNPQTLKQNPEMSFLNSTETGAKHERRTYIFKFMKQEHRVTT